MIESAILIAGVVAGLPLIELSDVRSNTNVADYASLEAIALTVLAVKNFALQIGILVCGLGGLILTPMLYCLRLVPRPVAGLGLIGYVAVVTSVVLTLFGVIDTKAGSGQLFYVPGGLFEALVFPVWLIFVGYRSEHSPIEGSWIETRHNEGISSGPGGNVPRAFVYRFIFNRFHFLFGRHISPPGR